MHPFRYYLRLMNMNDENSATCRDQIHPYPASMPDGDDAILIYRPVHHAHRSTLA